MQTSFDEKDNKEKQKHNSLSVKGKHTTQLCGFKRPEWGGDSEKPLGDPVPRLQHSFSAVAVQGLGYFWLQSLCHETLTLPHAANSLAILTMLHIGVMVSLLGSSYLCVSGLKRSRKDKTRHLGARHLQRLEGTQNRGSPLVPPLFLQSLSISFPFLHSFHLFPPYAFLLSPFRADNEGGESE